MESRFSSISKIFTPEILLSLVSVLWIYWLWQRLHFYKFCWNFPSHWGVPILGSLPKLRHPNNLFPTLARMFETKKSDNVLIWGGLYPIITTRDVHFIDYILTKREFLGKPVTLYHSMHNAFRGGLITNPVKKWQRIRPLLEPCFNRQSIQNLLPTFNKHKSEIITTLNSLDNGKEHKIHKLIYDGLCKLTMETTMGIHATETKKTIDFVNNFIETLDGCIKKVFAGFLNLAWLIAFYKSKETKNSQKFVDELVKHRIQEKKNKAIGETPSSNIFIDHAIKLYESDRISWQDITAESSTVFAAAYETTAFAVFSVLVMMAMHPDIQKNVYEELRGVFDDPIRDITYEDLNELPYFDIVIKEVLRIIPPAPFLTRHIPQNTKYKEWPAVIPKDISVLISIFHLHRHIDIWGPDAAEFKPSRFLAENLTEKQRKAYIPFSKGYRNCIGYRYAQSASKILAAGILLNFEFKTDFKYEDLRFVNHITTEYLIEPKLTVKRRKVLF